MTRSLYGQVLPEIFPHSIVLSKKAVQEYTAILIERESSFSITVDRPYTLWLSEASMQTIKDEVERKE